MGSSAAAVAAAAVPVHSELSAIADATSVLAQLNQSDGTNLSASGDGWVMSAQSGGTRLRLGAAFVGLEGGSHGGLVAVLAERNLTQLDPEATAVLASPVLSVDVLPNGGSTSGGSLPDAASGVTVVAEIPIDVSALAGNGSCSHTALFSPSPPLNETCIAGCCVDGGCACRHGFVGERCQHELRCVMVDAGAAHFDAGESCTTSGLIAADDAHSALGAPFHSGSGGGGGGAGRGARLVCSCVRLGVVAVLRFQLTPATNIFGAPSWAGWATTVEHLLPPSWALSLGVVSPASRACHCPATAEMRPRSRPTFDSPLSTNPAP